MLSFSCCLNIAILNGFLWSKLVDWFSNGLKFTELHIVWFQFVCCTLFTETSLEFYWYFKVFNLNAKIKVELVFRAGIHGHW